VSQESRGKKVLSGKMISLSCTTASIPSASVPSTSPWIHAEALSPINVAKRIILYWFIVPPRSIEYSRSGKWPSITQRITDIGRDTHGSACEKVLTQLLVFD
jgi:hypothetical protein